MKVYALSLGKMYIKRHRKKSSSCGNRYGGVSSNELSKQYDLGIAKLYFSIVMLATGVLTVEKVQQEENTFNPFQGL